MNTGEGATPGHEILSNPGDTGNWAKDILDEEPELKRNLERTLRVAAQKEKDDKKRSKILKVAAYLIGTGVLLWGAVSESGSEARESLSNTAENVGNSIVNFGELQQAEKVASILENSNITWVQVKAGYGLDQFLDETKWTEKYNHDTIREAIIEANKKQGIDVTTIQPGQHIVIPVHE